MVVKVSRPTGLVEPPRYTCKCRTALPDPNAVCPQCGCVAMSGPWQAWRDAQPVPWCHRVADAVAALLLSAFVLLPLMVVALLSASWKTVRGK